MPEFDAAAVFAPVPSNAAVRSGWVLNESRKVRYVDADGSANRWRNPPGAARNGADLLIGWPLNDVEKFYIERALELTGGRREEAATLLGIGERTLYRKIKEYDIKA